MPEGIYHHNTEVPLLKQELISPPTKIEVVEQQ